MLNAASPRRGPVAILPIGKPASKRAQRVSRAYRQADNPFVKDGPTEHGFHTVDGCQPVHEFRGVAMARGRDPAQALAAQ